MENNTEVLEYKTVKNFIHNELKLTKRDMYDFMESIIRQEVHARMDAIDFNALVKEHLSKCIERCVIEYDDLFETQIRKEITSAIVLDFMSRHSINITEKTNE